MLPLESPIPEEVAAGRWDTQWQARPVCVASRVAERASATSDLEEQLALRKFRRRLESVHQELSDYRDLIAEFRQAGRRVIWATQPKTIPGCRWYTSQYGTGVQSLQAGMPPTQGRS